MMLKKCSAIVALMMAVIVPTTFVHAQTANLDSAIQNLNFSLGVEWDQKDQAFRANAIKKFSSEIADLQKKGLSNEKIVAGIQAQLKDAKLIADLNRLTSVAKSSKMNAKQTHEMIAKYAMKAQKEGASWTGEGTLLTVGVVVVLAALIVLVAASGGTVSTGYYYDPYPYCYEVCDTVYDPYYGDYYYSCYCY